MKIDYDKIVDTMYMTFKKGKVSKTVRLDERLIVDLDKKGTLIGMEVLGASTQVSPKQIQSAIRTGVPMNVS